MKKILQLICASFLISTGILVAQPPNDNCVDAIEVEVGADEMTVVTVMGDTRGATGDDGVPAVCSGSWFQDDIWFMTTLPSDLPDDGVLFRCWYGTEPDDVPAVGMGLYASCDMDSEPLICQSNADPTTDRLELAAACLDPDSTYYIRVWSAGSPTDDAGTLRFGAYLNSPEARVLWSETFGDSLDGWTTFGTCADPDSNENAVWRYLPDGTLDDGSFVSAGTGIASRSICDGAVGVDSDYDDNLGNGLDADQNPITPGPCTAPGQYILVSPAIYTGDWDAAGVSLTWTQLIRQFQSTYFIGYRTAPTGGAFGDWINIEVNQEFPINSNTAFNDMQRFFLGGATEGDSLQIRFVYNANYYFWGIDDVQLIETEAHNLRSQSNFFAIAPALRTPLGQSYPWYPLNDVYNAGAIAQTNVNLNFTAYDADMTEIYNQDLAYGTIAPDSLAENVNFPVPVEVPDDIPAQQFTGMYTVTSDSATMDNDFDFSDNSNTFNWWTTIGEYALEDGFTRSVAVNDALYDDGAPLSYAFGNHFYFPKGTCFYATSITWGISNPADIAGVPVNIVLWEWADENSDQIVQSSERSPVGFSSVTFTGDEGNNLILDTPLDNFQNPGEPIMLDDEQAYLAMIEYNAEEVEFMFLLANDAIDYGAVHLSSDQADEPIYGPVLGFSADGNIQGIDYEIREFGDDGRVFFGPDLIGLVRLNVEHLEDSECIIATDDPLPAYNVVEIFPNPASTDVTVKLELTEIVDEVYIRIMDVTGKLVDNRRIQGVKNETVAFDVSGYASGAYIMRIETELGSRAQRFVVQN